MRYFMAACLLLLLAGPGAGEEEESLFNAEIAVSPWEGETASKGTFKVRHEGEGEPPKTGYFKKHEPGEVAEFHFFVPEGLEEGHRSESGVHPKYRSRRQGGLHRLRPRTRLCPGRHRKPLGEPFGESGDDRVG